MPIANINKLYYGETAISKVMYGETVVYESTPPYDYEIKNHEVTTEPTTAINTDLKIIYPYNEWSNYKYEFEFTNVMRTNTNNWRVCPMLASVGCISYNNEHQPSFSLLRSLEGDGAILFAQPHARHNSAIVFNDEINGGTTNKLIDDWNGDDGIDTNVYKLVVEAHLSNNWNVSISFFVNGVLTRTFNDSIDKFYSGNSGPLLLGCAHADQTDIRGTTTPMLIKHFGFNYL